ncbi:MAG: AGE family epimerase/isomerase [bacterium]
MSDPRTPDPSETASPRHIPSDRADELCEIYRAALFDDVVPWWLEHSLDREHGGYLTRLERDGRAYSNDKDMWMTGRQVWMFSHLYNQHEPCEEWLEAARLGAEFMLRYAFKPDGKIYFRLKRDGAPMSEVLSKYTEVFAAIGLAEYSKAAQADALWERAMQVYNNLMPKLGRAENTPLLGYPVKAEFHLHADDMCRITVAWVFNEIRPDERFENDLTMSVDSILKRHWKPDRKALLENVAMDGSEMLDIPEGRMFHPGHAVESAWMLMDVARRRGDESLMETAADITLASLEHGWDNEFGGLRYITNIDRTPVHNIEADCKLWWPHGEALYATLLGWMHTGRNDLRQWYEKVHEYTFGHFPDPEYGEWFGYLNRDGSPIWTAKSNGWKGFFHLPRVLFRCYQLLR